MLQLVCKDLCLGYEGQKVIENLNFEINSGDHLAIIGENGAGKSTLLKALLGLLKPYSGEIIWQDGEANLGKTLGHIGYLPQQTQVQRDFPASVSEVVLSGFSGNLGSRMFYTKEEKVLAEENMQKLEILGLKNKCYRELSGGQQQRVLLARAICGAKKILILDEPSAGLDQKASIRLYDTIEELNKRDNMTIIMVVHEIDMAERYANKILHISHEKTFFGTKESYLNSDFFTKITRDFDVCEEGARI